jgi:cyclopropane-fatty-acyl-phospholipid synthase
MAHEVLEAASRWFEPEQLLNHRLHYARTLREWEKRLITTRGRAEQVVSGEKVADYLRYLDEAASGFENGAIQLLRVAFRRH